MFTSSSFNASAAFGLFSLLCFASSSQTFPCFAKLFVAHNAHGIFAFFETFLARVFARVFLFCCSWMYKTNNPGRPIVSACSCPTELISSYLDKIMAPIVRSSPSYVKDSQHALQIFRDFNFLGEDKLIFTMDITSLYTVIPNGEGLLALKHFF